MLEITLIFVCVTFFIWMKTVFQKVDVFKNMRPNMHPCGEKNAVVYKN